MAFGGVNDSLQFLSAPQLDFTRGRLHAAYFKLGVSNGSITLPPDFAVLTDYTKISTIPNGSPLRYPLGLIYTTDLSGRYDVILDFISYIDIITSTDDATMENTWFSPAIDVNGVYKKKYDVITKFYKDMYDIDLRAIGNLKN